MHALKDKPLPAAGAAYEVARSGPAQVLIRLSGRLDLTATQRLGPSLFEFARSGRTVDVDLGAVAGIEPAGLALLLGCRRLAHASGGQLRLVAASPAADRALRQAGLDRVLPLGGWHHALPALSSC